jgi:hypothetical protein
MNRHVLILCLLCLMYATPEFASAHEAPADCGPVCAFQSIITVADPGVRVPTVVEVPLPEGVYGPVAIQEMGGGEWQPSYITETGTVRATPFTITSDYGQPYNRLTDTNPLTFEQFALPTDTQGEVTLVVTFAEPVTISALRLLLDDQVALPRTVAVSVLDREENEIVVAPAPVPNSGLVRFLRTTGKTFLVTFAYAQPLRITELALLEADLEATTLRAVRFLAQPGEAYRVYAEPDRSVQIDTAEAGDLRSDTGVRRLTTATLSTNPSYQVADVDDDHIPDRLDNCVSTANPNQEDVDGNGRGDECDDFDRDGVVNPVDNCRDLPNRDQRDEDGDGVGDECDEAESRFTERNAWIPWAGMGFAAIVLVGLFALTLRRPIEMPK